jgi:hypothetical protein
MRRTLITASVIAASVLLAACSGGASSGSSSAENAASQAPTTAESTAASASASAPAGYEALIADGKVTTAKICDTYTDVLTKFIANTNAQLKSGNKYVDDPYTAAKYINNVAWVDSDSKERLDSAVDKAATSALNVVTDGQAGKITDLAPYIADSMEACGLTTQYSTAQGKASEVNELAADLAAEAENKPWYPRGYSEYSGDDSLAWKWTDESCGYSSGYCWTMRVTSKDGCYSGLYGEINIEKNDVVIDYTNDVIGSLGAGDTAKLSFVHFGSGQGTLSAYLSELSCNNF